MLIKCHIFYDDFLDRLAKHTVNMSHFKYFMFCSNTEIPSQIAFFFQR